LTAVTVLLGCSSFRGISDAGTDAAADHAAPDPCDGGPAGRFRGSPGTTVQTQLRDPSTGALLDFHLKTATRDAEGRVLLAGGARGCLQSGQFAAAVARLTRTLELDRSFGAGGLTCARALAPATTHTTPYSILVDARGRVVVAGVSSEPPSTTRGFLARWTSDGRLDETFGEGGVVDYRPGRVPTSPGHGVAFFSVLAEGDKLVAAGSNSEPFAEGSMGLAARFLEDGTVDPTFHGGAAHADPEVSGWFAATITHGSLLLAGSTRSPVGVRLRKLDAQGDPAMDFGVSGVADHPRGGDVRVRSLGVDGAGRVVVGGGRAASYSSVGAPPVFVRYQRDGSPDMTYGARGEAVFSDAAWTFEYEFERAMRVRCDGSVLAAGHRSGQGLVIHLDPSGLVVADFGTNGAAGVSNPSPGALFGLTVALLDGSAPGSLLSVTTYNSNVHQTLSELRP
jgi:uncharacterized delta-60 repeat protein